MIWLCAFRREWEDELDPQKLAILVERLRRAIRDHYPTLDDFCRALKVNPKKWATEYERDYRPINLLRIAIRTPEVFVRFCLYTVAEEPDSDMVRMLKPAMARVEMVRDGQRRRA